jgi:hypothetical protein
MAWFAGPIHSRIKKEIDALRGLIEGQEKISTELRKKLNKLAGEVGQLAEENVTLTHKGARAEGVSTDLRRKNEELTERSAILKSELMDLTKNPASFESYDEPDMERLSNQIKTTLENRIDELALDLCGHYEIDLSDERDAERRARLESILADKILRWPSAGRALMRQLRLVEGMSLAKDLKEEVRQVVEKHWEGAPRGEVDGAIIKDAIVEIIGGPDLPSRLGERIEGIANASLKLIDQMGRARPPIQFWAPKEGETFDESKHSAYEDCRAEGLITFVVLPGCRLETGDALLAFKPVVFTSLSCVPKREKGSSGVRL